METVAVCPAMDPATTMHQIDNGWIGYRLFFVRKWHRALRAKQRAFPDHYRFEQALQLRSVSALTDLFVSEHTDYAVHRRLFQGLFAHRPRIGRYPQPP